MKKLNLVLLGLAVAVLFAACLGTSEEISNIYLNSFNEISKEESNASSDNRNVISYNSISENENSDVKHQLYEYKAVGYLDSENRYLLLYREHLKEHGFDTYYNIYDTTDKTFADEISGDFGIYKLSIGNGCFSVPQYASNVDKDNENPKISLITYNEKAEIIARLSLPDKYSFYNGIYIPDKNKYCIFYEKNDEHFLSIFDMEGQEEKVLMSLGENSLWSIISFDDKLAVLGGNNSKNGAALNILDFNGSIIASSPEDKIYPVINAVKAGKYIYLPSAEYYDPKLYPNATEIILAFDTEQGSFKELKGETGYEGASIRLTPDGKKAVSFMYDSDIVKVYDTENGEKINEILLDNKTEKSLFCLYDEEIIFYNRFFEGEKNIITAKGYKLMG